jgi:hypothetical protein
MTKMFEAAGVSEKRMNYMASEVNYMQIGLRKLDKHPMVTRALMHL